MMLKRIAWYTRKCKEFSQMPMSERKQRRHERLMKYKEAMNERLSIYC